MTQKRMNFNLFDFCSFKNGKRATRKFTKAKIALKRVSMIFIVRKGRGIVLVYFHLSKIFFIYGIINVFFSIYLLTTIIIKDECI